VPLGSENVLDAPRILVIDDEPISVETIARILHRGGFPEVQVVTDPLLAEAQFRAFKPDLVLLDFRMPEMDGLQVLKRLIAATPESTYLPIVMLTGDPNPERRQQALALGAKDFVSKPFDISEIYLRIRNLLETRALHLKLEGQNRRLEERVADRTRELLETQREVLLRLARAAEFRDDATGQHTQRVASIAATLARAIGLDPIEVELIFQAAPLHDVGKIGIPDAVLLKPGRLDPEEFEVMKRHTTIGARLLGDGRSALSRMAEKIARSHHERWDGGGYPEGLAGEAIPLASRLVALADVFDALTHDRPYRPAWTVEATLAEISRLKARYFDPRLTDVFLRLDHEAMGRLPPEGGLASAPE